MILCWLNELLGSSDKGFLSAALHRHRQSCATCRRSSQNTKALENLLGKDFQISGKSPSPFLPKRIIESVQKTDLHLKPALPGQMFVWRLALPVGICAVFAFVLFELSRKNNPQPDRRDSTQLAKVESVHLAFPPIHIRVEDPLTLEMQSLLADSKNAARSLAANFLPDNLNP